MLTEASILATTYYHLFAVRRKENIVNPDTGVSESVFKDIVKDVKCAVSKKDMPNLTENGIQTYSASHLLFTFPDIDIREGDFITAKVEGQTMEFIASRPFKYPSHIEVPISFREIV